MRSASGQWPRAETLGLMNAFISWASHLIRRSINTNIDGNVGEWVQMTGGTIYTLISMEERAESIRLLDTWFRNNRRLSMASLAPSHLISPRPSCKHCGAKPQQNIRVWVHSAGSKWWKEIGWEPPRSFGAVFFKLLILQSLVKWSVTGKDWRTHRNLKQRKGKPASVTPFSLHVAMKEMLEEAEFGNGVNMRVDMGFPNKTGQPRWQLSPSNPPPCIFPFTCYTALESLNQSFIQFQSAWGLSH